MNAICEACQEPVKSNASIHLKIEDRYRHLCYRCYNETMSEYLGVEFEQVHFDPVTLPDKTGVDHVFNIHTRLAGDKIVMEALEGNEDSYGYEFSVIEDVDIDILVLFQKLYEKVKRGLSLQYIEPAEFTSYQITDKNVARGYISSNSDDSDNSPVIVIDGKDIAWSEFGQMLSMYEGFNFKIEIYDKTEEK